MTVRKKIYMILLFVSFCLLFYIVINSIDNSKWKKPPNNLNIQLFYKHGSFDSYDLIYITKKNKDIDFYIVNFHRNYDMLINRINVDDVMLNDVCDISSGLISEKNFSQLWNQIISIGKIEDTEFDWKFYATSHGPGIILFNLQNNNLWQNIIWYYKCFPSLTLTLPDGEDIYEKLIHFLYNNEVENTKKFLYTLKSITKPKKEIINIENKKAIITKILLDMKKNKKIYSKSYFEDIIGFTLKVLNNS